MWRCISYALILWFVVHSPLGAQDLIGMIQGRVIDEATEQPLAGAVIELVQADLSAVTDSAGCFVIGHVGVGSHRVRASKTGYMRRVLSGVTVRRNDVTIVIIRLPAAALTLDDITVAADYFPKAARNNISTVNLSREEILRSPGSLQDISRLIRALPGVTQQGDLRNDMIVRSGSPAENLVLVDHIEIPNLNHFPTQGSSGGVVSLLNTDLIREATFHAGGFSSVYGDHLSSVLSVQLRDGNREKATGGVFMGFAGAGGLVEGPLLEGHGSFVLSARRSFLELVGAAGNPEDVPVHGDIQGKVTYHPSASHKLSLLAIAGFSDIELEAEDAGDFDVISHADQVVAGVSWRWLWSNEGEAATSLAFTSTEFRSDVSEPVAAGLSFTNDSHERHLSLRSGFRYRLGPSRIISWGITAQRILSDIDIGFSGTTNALNVVEPGFRRREPFHASKIGGYLDYEQQIFKRLGARIGLRLDYFDLSKESNLAPRVALSYELAELTKLTAAAGVYYQTLPAVVLAQHPANRLVPNQRADHLMLGVKTRLAPSMQLSVEVYSKTYSNMAFDIENPTVPVVDALASFETPVPGRVLSGGGAAARGIEGLIQKKLAHRFYGSMGYGYSVAKYKDLEQREHNRAFDNRHVFSVIVGYQPDASSELSLRWRFVGGAPYTPFDETRSTEFGTAIIRSDRINAERLPAYHRLDLRWNYRGRLGKFPLFSYFALINSYNRRNISRFFWNTRDNRVDAHFDGFSILPVGGFELRF